jgi:hypothetical protein
MSGTLPLSGTLYSHTVGPLEGAEVFDEEVERAIRETVTDGRAIFSVTFAASSEHFGGSGEYEDPKSLVTRYTAFLLCWNPAPRDDEREGPAP